MAHEITETDNLLKDHSHVIAADTCAVCGASLEEITDRGEESVEVDAELVACRDRALRDRQFIASCRSRGIDPCEAANTALLRAFAVLSARP